MLITLYNNNEVEVLDFLAMNLDDQEWFEHNNISVDFVPVVPNKIALGADLGDDNRTILVVDLDEPGYKAMSKLRVVAEYALNEGKK